MDMMVGVAPPMALIAELTHRCPLQCGYCSNPLALEGPAGELSTEAWCAVLDQAAALGVLQVHFTGGEPMARRDLVALVAHASGLGLYTNLITSGVLLTEAAMAALRGGGIDHVQLSFQDAEAAAADAIGVLPGAHERKCAAAGRIRAAGLPLTANFVVHRANVGNIAGMIALAETLGAERIEIAHVQYYGWALRNRAALLPSQDQLASATRVVEAARARLSGQIVIDHVAPDYYAARPKACMGGWGARFINISPSGRAMPCHAAETIPGLSFPDVRTQTLDYIWQHADAFTRFRGTDWMPAPCRGCDERERDWGGCRCQAFALTGDAAATDPACNLSPHHGVMRQAMDEPPNIMLPRRFRGG